MCDGGYVDFAKGVVTAKAVLDLLAACTYFVLPGTSHFPQAAMFFGFFIADLAMLSL